MRYNAKPLFNVALDMAYTLATNAGERHRTKGDRAGAAHLYWMALVAARRASELLKPERDLAPSNFGITPAQFLTYTKRNLAVYFRG